VPGTSALTEPQWQQIAPLLAPRTPPRGRPQGDLRRQLEGMLAVMRTGAPWRDVPSRYGPWQTIYARYALWVRTGLWGRIAAILHPDTSEEAPLAPP
jgi:transposase